MFISQSKFNNLELQEINDLKYVAGWKSNGVHTYCIKYYFIIYRKTFWMQNKIPVQC